MPVDRIVRILIKKDGIILFQITGIKRNFVSHMHGTKRAKPSFVPCIWDTKLRS
jgi:hypothetical protein